MEKEEILVLVKNYFKKNPNHCNSSNISKQINDKINKAFHEYSIKAHVAASKNETLPEGVPMIDISREVELLQEVLWDLVVSRALTPVETKGDSILQWKFKVTGDL